MSTELLNTFTHNQLALLGSLLSLVVTGTLMSLSFYIGQRVRGETTRHEGRQQHTVSLPLSETIDKELESPDDRERRRPAA